MILQVPPVFPIARFSMIPSAPRPAVLTFIAALSLGAVLPVNAGENPSAKSAVVVPPPAASDDGWTFTIRPYGWMTGLDGNTGVGSLVTDLDIDFAEVFDHLDMAFFLQAEARRGRVGILFDGFFAELSGAGSPPGPFHEEADFSLQQTYAEIALACRLLEGRAGFLDVFAGVRYNSLDLELHADQDDQGIRAFSTGASRRITSEIESRVSEAVENKLGAIRGAASSRVRSLENEIAADVGRRLDRNHPVGRGLPGRGPTRDVHRLVRQGITAEIRELVRARVEARVASARAEVRRRIDARVAAAEKKLASAIEKELKSNLPESASGKEDWVDPFLGFRGQWNLTEQLYLAGRADIGGFGVGSELTWQASAALGWKINSSWSAEAGYRYLAPDFEDGSFTYEVASNGFFVSLGYTF